MFDQWIYISGWVLILEKVPVKVLPKLGGSGSRVKKWPKALVSFFPPRLVDNERKIEWMNRNGTHTHSDVATHRAQGPTKSLFLIPSIKLGACHRMIWSQYRYYGKKTGGCKGAKTLENHQVLCFPEILTKFTSMSSFTSVDKWDSLNLLSKGSYTVGRDLWPRQGHDLLEISGKSELAEADQRFVKTRGQLGSSGNSL